MTRIATAIADGAPVDWASEESTASPAELPLLREMRLLADLAASYAGPGPGDEWGPLRLGRRIGKGAFADVFRAHDERLGRDVALKLLRHRVDDPEQALAEGRALARLRHPGVATVYGADHVDGQVGIWMEIVEGRTLEQTLVETGTWDAQRAALAGAELLDALQAVHAAGLVHRDVKAQNVMRDAHGRIVLMDFGLGRPLGEQRARPAGTLVYMAPEALAGEPATTRSDVYAVGVLLHHLVTGGYPHEEDLRKAAPTLPGAFVDIVERALDRDPARRFLTAEEMKVALLDSIPARRNIAAWLAAALAGLAATFYLAWPRPAVERAQTGAPRPSQTTASPPPVATTLRGASVPDTDPFVAPLGRTGQADDPKAAAADRPFSVSASLRESTLLLRCSAAVSLYVVAIDEQYRPTLIFPMPGTAGGPANPLVPGEETRIALPPQLAGRPLVAIALARRLVSLESAVGRLRLPAGEAAAGVALTETALSSLAEALEIPEDGAARFLAGAPPIAGHAEIVRAPWVRRLRAAR